jgi:hypothetical protein
MLYLPVFLRWGIQRRFLKHGYVDLGFKGGYNFALENHSMSYGFFGTYIDAGLAFTRDRQKLDFDKLCPVLKCHAADRFLLKSNLADIISLTTIRRIFIGSVYPNIAAEFKLGSSPFSINTQVGSRVEYATSWSLDYMNIFTLSPRALIEGRYYYNLKRRILTGKTGNGLSANYVSAGAMFSGEYQIFQNAGYRSNLSHAFAGVIVSTGIQRLISNHLYFDLNVGLAYGVENNVDSVNNTNENENKTIFNMGIAIGYRF